MRVMAIQHLVLARVQGLMRVRSWAALQSSTRMSNNQFCMTCRQAARTASPKARVPRSARRFEQAFSHDTMPTPGSPHRTQVRKGARRAFEKALAAEQEATTRLSMQAPEARMRDVELGPGGADPGMPARLREAPGSAARQDLSHHSFTGGEALHAPIRTSVTHCNARYAPADIRSLHAPIRFSVTPSNARYTPADRCIYIYIYIIVYRSQAPIRTSVTLSNARYAAAGTHIPPARVVCFKRDSARATPRVCD